MHCRAADTAGRAGRTLIGVCVRALRNARACGGRDVFEGARAKTARSERSRFEQADSFARAPGAPRAAGDAVGGAAPAALAPAAGRPTLGYSPPMNGASQADRDYFARIARANLLLADEVAPASLDEMFDRLERITREFGDLAQPGIAPADETSRHDHAHFLARMRSAATRATQRP